MNKETFLSGGVALLHTKVNGKHFYEVGKVLTSSPSDFGRKGDKLLMINDAETQDLPPKALVRMLCSEYPLLTMHRAHTGEEEKKCPELESMLPYHQESTVLNFSLAMVRDEENPLVPEESELDLGDMEGDFSTDEEMLLVSMKNTSVEIMRSRGCNSSKQCTICGGAGCTINDFVIATKQCTITSAYREQIQKNVERGQFMIQSLLQKNICSENIHSPRRQVPHITTSTTANITIYYYLSNVAEDFDKGVPVVLNFSGSTNFIKCIIVNDRPVLTVECCDKTKLQSILKDDPITWPFVFYLTTTKDNHRRFESAACSGWFIHTKPSGLVCVSTRELIT